MAQFDETRKALEAARSAAFRLSRDIFKERQRLRRCEREWRRLERFAGRTEIGTVDSPALAALDEKCAAIKAGIARLSDELGAARARESEHFADFRDFTDPRENIARLDDSVPILLLPLRIETRFKSGTSPNDESVQLWVRVYPDDVAIDAFEDTLSESEITRAQAYWVNIWRSGGIESEDRGAWKTLVASHGSGRAFWVVQTYRPLNEADKPVKDPDRPAVILVIPTQQPLAEPEAAAVVPFWEAFWRAGTDAGAQQAAVDALVAAVGAERAGELRRDYTPKNLADEAPAVARADVVVNVTFVVFPPDDQVAARAGGWSQTPHVDVMPDRLVLIGYSGDERVFELLGNPIPSPLVVAPDPSAEEDEQLRPEGEDLRFGEEMVWVADFEKAIAVGMGFRVPLSPSQARLGFDKLVVLGVRLRADEADGQAALEALIAHHLTSRAGFSILPQGRPTNNDEGEDADYSWREDSDVSFDHYFGENGADDPTGWFEKTDGRWLAEILGLRPEALRAVPFYGRRDLCEARAMNVALWPGTLGYFMDSMMDPVFAPATVEQARAFFTRHVSARGLAPAIRVGKQPYGILPATVRSRITWLFPRQPGTTIAPIPSSEEFRFLQQLYGLLRTVENDWSALQDKVSHIGKEGDAHQILLDVVGLHSGSVEHYQRYAESFQQLYNRMALQGAGGAFLAVLLALGYVRSGLDLLATLGYAHSDEGDLPDILEKLFLRAPNLLKGDLIDDRPLSETEGIRAYTEAGDDYITWLIDAARTSHDALRRQEGFIDGRPPTALLYLMLQHALDLSYVETSVRLFLSAGLLTAQQASATRREAKFIHVQESELAEPTAASASRWQYLYRTDPVITGNPERTVGQFIPTVMTTMVATQYLNRQLRALEHLRGAPTAALERAFTEHLDLCIYRLDAWYGGLLSRQLEGMRYRTDVEGGTVARPGLYLGAYGWLENVRSEHKVLTPVELPRELGKIFARDGDPPLMRDSTNAGYIHAPSLNHAVTAAVLRNGYLSNATPDNPGSLAINLSSERVRLALSIIEGMDGGQSLAALLGYQFERGLHDRTDAEVDAFIYDLRKAFPLYADRFSNTRTADTDELGRRISIRKLEARNVLDGLALVEHTKTSGNQAYPFGIADLPTASAAQADAVTAEAQRIADIADAVADVAMAESLHQVVQGNYDRAGATLDTYSKGKFAAMPEVIRTPRSGVTLIHRVALHLEAGLDPNDPANTSPRAQAEPAINRWLSQILPPADRVVCVATVTDPADQSQTTHTVNQADLGLNPIDLLYVADTDSQKAMTILDDLVESHVVATHAPRPHHDITISYRQRIEPIDQHVPFFELAAMIRSARALLLRSRALRASDMALVNEATEGGDEDVSLDPARVTLVRGTLATELGNLGAFQAALQSLIDNEQVSDIIDGIDQSIADFVLLALALSPFAEQQTGIGALFDEKRRIFKGLLETLAALTDRWDGRLAEFDDAIDAYNNLPAGTDDARKFLELQKAERLIATTRTDPLPATPDGFRDDLVNVSRLQFTTQLDALKALHGSADTLSGLYNGIDGAKVTNAQFDPAALDLQAETSRILALAEDLAGRAASLAADGDGRLQAANARIADHDTAVLPRDKVTALTAAAKLLLGEHFQIVPEFGLTADQADEWGNAWGPGASADRAILAYLETDLARRFPVDDWLYGIARVREPMHHLENTLLLGESLGGGAITLQPLQFPYRPDGVWLGLDFPAKQANGVDDFAIDEDKLLYTAHYAVPFDKTARQCGLLLDEWTEVVPSKTEDTGVAFHYDRPNSEAPQALLLALPPQFTRAWQWQDLVDMLHETLDLAKQRAIEPEHIDTTAYARFLPALISPVTLFPITASLNLAFNNGLAAALVAAGGGGNE